jgi:membrane-associated protein
MDFITQNIIPYILLYKYTALFVIFFMAAFILPVPSGNILVATIAFAVEGYFKIGLVIVISIIANLLGDNCGYWLARSYGEKIFSFIGFRNILRSKAFNTIEEKFRRRPGFIILISRFDAISTSVINLLAGLGKVSYRKFIVHESIGTLLQVSFYSSVGYFFGHNWQMVNTTMGKVYFVCVVLCIILVVSFWSKIIAYLKKGISY